MMTQLWKLGLGFFIVATTAGSLWGQPYDTGQQQGSTESFMEWTAEQVQQIRDAVSSLQMKLESVWSGSRSVSGIQNPTMEPGYQPSMGRGRGQSLGGQQSQMPGGGQNVVPDPFNQGSRPSMGRSAGGRGICPPGTGRSGLGSARGMGAGRGRSSGGAFPGQIQNAPSGSGGGRGAAGLTSMGSGRGRGSGAKSSGVNASGKGKGRRRK